MLNKVMLIGRIGRDPEIRSMQSGGRVCNLSVATSEHWTDKASGERKEKTEWSRVVIFDDRLVDVCEKYASKGRLVYVEGQLQTRKWQDQSGQDRYQTEVVLQKFRGEIRLLDKAPDDTPVADNARATAGGQRRGGELDDDIPFACEWRV